MSQQVQHSLSQQQQQMTIVTTTSTQQRHQPLLPPSATELRISQSAPGSPGTTMLQGGAVYTQVSLTSSSAYPNSITSMAALHQLPTVISKPKVIVSNGTQVMLNGPSGLTALANGAAHVEVKKDPSSQNPALAEKLQAVVPQGQVVRPVTLVANLTSALQAQQAPPAQQVQSPIAQQYQAGQQAAHQLMSALAAQNTTVSSSTGMPVYNQVSQSTMPSGGQALTLISQSGGGVQLLHQASPTMAPSQQSVSLQQFQHLQQQHHQQQLHQQQQQQQQQQLHQQQLQHQHQQVASSLAAQQPVLVTALNNAPMSMATKRSLEENKDYRNNIEDCHAKQMKIETEVQE